MKVLVRAPNWIGDCVLALPALNSLQQGFPEAEIWINARDWVGELFRGLSFVEGIISLPPQRNLGSLARFAGNLRTLDFDAGLLLTNSFGSALLFAWARIPQRWGYTGDGRGPLLTRSIRRQDRRNPGHQVFDYLHLVEALGGKPSPIVLTYPLLDGEAVWAETFLKERGISHKAPVVVLNPGGYFGSAKRWPPELFGDLAHRLQVHNQAQIVIVGAQHEKYLAEAVSRHLSIPPVDLTGRTTLRQLAAVLSRSDLCITNDSGPMHLANALKIPVVALFGPTDPGATAPFQQPSVWIHKPVPCWPCSYRDCPFDHRCMTSISPEEVHAACTRWLP